MLHLYIGHKKGYFLSGNNLFDNMIDEEVITTDFSRKIIKAVDKSEVYSKGIILSPILGSIPPERLSGGVKSLMILKYSDYPMYLESMGDNCLGFLKEICDEKEINMCTTGYRRLFQHGFKNIEVVNNNEIVTSSRRFLDLYLKFGD